MPTLDLGKVIGPKGDPGEPGQDGLPGQKGDQGIQGEPGSDAKINGVNSLTIKTGSGLTSSQSGSTFTIDTTDSVKNTIIKVETLVRPNLLDNWYFGNPVNQRGRTEYGAGTLYSIDRWIAGSDGGNLSILDSFIRINKTNTYFNLSQILDNASNFHGLTLTISALGKNLNVVFEVDGTFPTMGATYDYGIASASFTVPADAKRLIIHLQANEIGYCDVYAAKLELGNNQTLAHQDATGAWILNEIPDYGEQLRRCQMYFYRTTSGHYFNGAFYSTGSGAFYVPTPVQLRTTPTLSIEYAGTVFDKSGNRIDLTSSNITVESADSFGVKLIIQPPTSVSVGPAALCDARLSFSADL